MINREKKAFIGVKLPLTMKKLVGRVIELDTHISESEFVRAAIREKITREAPDLYQALFKKSK